MAKLGFGYKVETENKDNQMGGDFEIMPEMHAVLEATAMDLDIQGDPDSPDYVEAKIVFDVIEPEQFKGRKMWAYWPILDNIKGQDNKRFAKFGKPNFDRLCLAIGIDGEPDDTDDLLFKQFVAKVGINVGGPNPAGGMYKDRNEIKKFFFPTEPEKYPEIGVIAGPATPKPANDNTKAANTNTATKPPAAAGAKPWAKKA